MKINYQILCDEEIKKMTANGRVPKLLLHSCCGPCSTYVMEYLSKFFDVTVLFYNPNIYPEEEYEKRLEAQKKAVFKIQSENAVKLVDLTDKYEVFLEKVVGFEAEREGGARCEKCFRIRLEKAAFEAKKLGFDCFTTTLSVSPHKNAELLNDLGRELSEKYDIPYLVADFKKREGYKRSIELSKEFGLYRQEYCGCEFSIPQDR